MPPLHRGQLTRSVFLACGCLRLIAAIADFHEQIMHEEMGRLGCGGFIAGVGDGMVRGWGGVMLGRVLSGGCRKQPPHLGRCSRLAQACAFLANAPLAPVAAGFADGGASPSVWVCRSLACPQSTSLDKPG